MSTRTAPAAVSSTTEVAKDEIPAALPAFRKAVAAYNDSTLLHHQRVKDYKNYETANRDTIEQIEKSIKTRTDDNNRMSSIVAQKIKELKGKLSGLKSDIQSVRQAIKNAEDEYAAMTEDVNKKFNERKEEILAESREVDAQLNHYSEWQRQSDTFKSHLSELKSTIHHNRVLCSEGIAETRQNAQAKIEKHRIRLAEAIRQARAESLRLRSGDISNLSTTFLTQSEAHLQSLNSQIASSEHLSEVNQTIDDDNASMLREIERLTKKNQHLKEQEEKQKSVLAKLKTIKREFAEREHAEEQMKKAVAAKAIEEKKREEEVRARNVPQPKPEFHMSQEQEAFITFLNECATSVRSILIDMVGDESKRLPENDIPDRFEAPKLSAMITEIKQMTEQLSDVKPNTAGSSKPVLTPAAAYFAFSAPFDESDNFIASENWSFAKYEPFKPATASQQKKPKIIRVKTATNKNPL